jgi:hypothetical protein
MVMMRKISDFSHHHHQKTGEKGFFLHEKNWKFFSCNPQTACEKGIFLLPKSSG